MTTRSDDLINFYRLLDRLSEKIGGYRLLSECGGRTRIPSRGVYFFMENGEFRSNSGDGLRVTRVGTHALKLGSKSTLWTRLSQHKGALTSGSGNHRGSIFRLLVGATLMDETTKCFTWGQGATAKGEIRVQERPIEEMVSTIIRSMPFLFLDVDDAATPTSLRGYIERNSIALLSNFQKPPLDAHSLEWRGHRSDREKVRLSGLWNQNHVDEVYDPAFIVALETLIDKMKGYA